MSTHRFSASRAIPLDPARAFEQVLTLPLTDLFWRRHLALPAIREVRGQVGEWGTVGGTRTIVLADGGTLHETLVLVESPHRFAYTLDRITGPMKVLTSRVDGEWALAPAGTGVRVTWTWTLHPATAPARLAMPLFGRMWQGYADRALARMETLLVV